MFNIRCNKKLVLFIFTLSNISLAYLIYGEITLKREVEYDQDDTEEHPRMFNNTTVKPKSREIVTLKSFSMPPIYRVNATDPTSHRNVLAEMFNPKAYYNVDLEYLNQQADKAFKEIQPQCERMTMIQAKMKSKATGIPLCSCAPNTLGEWQIVVFNTQACL